MRRLLPALVAIVLLGGWFSVDRLISAANEGEVELALPNASLTAQAGLDSSWYCPIGSRNPAGYATNVVNVSNLSSSRAKARVTVLTGDADGVGASKQIELAPYRTVTVAATEVDPYTEGADNSSLAAIQVDIVGTRGSVTHTVQTAVGETTGQCATQASDSWYFATGRVKEGSREYLALMNPFEEDISVDVQLESVGHSTTVVEAWQGLTVFAKSVRLLEVHEAPGVRGREHIGAHIQSRSGRLIAERLQIIDEAIFGAQQAVEAGDDDGDVLDSNRVTGASLQLGSQETSLNWIFTAGRVNSDTSHFLSVFNPRTVSAETIEDDTANIRVEVWPTDPAIKETYSLVPIERNVLPSDVEVIDLTTEIKRLGFPLPFDFTVQVISDNEIPVVAERWEFGKKVEDAFDFSSTAIPEQDPVIGDGGDAILPENANPKSPDSATSNLMTSGGVQFSAGKNWVVPWVPTPTDRSTWVIVYAPNPTTKVTVTYPQTKPLEVMIDPKNLQDGGAAPISVGHGRAYIKVPILSTGSNVQGGPIEVTADKPIYIEAQVITGNSADIIPGVPVISYVE